MAEISLFFCNMLQCVVYRRGRIIEHLTAHIMVGHGLSRDSTVAVGVSCQPLRDERGGPLPMEWRFPA